MEATRIRTSYPIRRIENFNALCKTVVARHSFLLRDPLYAPERPLGFHELSPASQLIVSTSMLATAITGDIDRTWKAYQAVNLQYNDGSRDGLYGVFGNLSYAPLNSAKRLDAMLHYLATAISGNSRRADNAFRFLDEERKSRHDPSLIECFQANDSRVNEEGYSKPSRIIASLQYLATAITGDHQRAKEAEELVEKSFKVDLYKLLDSAKYSESTKISAAMQYLATAINGDIDRTERTVQAVEERQGDNIRNIFDRKEYKMFFRIKTAYSLMLSSLTEDVNASVKLFEDTKMDEDYLRIIAIPIGLIFEPFAVSSTNHAVPYYVHAGQSLYREYHNYKKVKPFDGWFPKLSLSNHD